MPSMDKESASRRFRELPTSHPLPPQASSDTSTHRNHGDGSGSEYGSLGGPRSASHSPRAQEPQTDSRTTGANSLGQNLGSNDLHRPSNAYATVHVENAPFASSGAPIPPLGSHFLPGSGRGHVQQAYVDYGGHVSSLPLLTPSPQHPGGRSNSATSAAGSVQNQGSHQSGHRSSQSVSPESQDAGHAQRVQEFQFRAEGHVPQAKNASPVPQPHAAYGAHTRQIGTENVGFYGGQQVMAGHAHMHQSIPRFPPGGLPGGTPQQFVFDSPRHSPDLLAPFGNPGHPSTPRLDFQTRQLSLDDVGLPYGSAMHQGHGLPPLIPPPPMGYPGMGDIDMHQQPQLPMTHIDAANLGANLTLDMLSDSPIPGHKPNYPYPTLIKAAILGSPRKRLTLQGIYKALEDRFEWFRNNSHDKAWQNSIRHNLSLNKAFKRLSKPITEPGKGNYWMVDFEAGEGNKRERKRNKKPSKNDLARRVTDPSASSSHQSTENSTSDEEDNSRHGSPSYSQTLPPSLDTPAFNQAHNDSVPLNEGYSIDYGHLPAQPGIRIAQPPYPRSHATATAAAAAMQDTQLGVMPQFPMHPGHGHHLTATFAQPPVGHLAFGQPSFDWETVLNPGVSSTSPTWGTAATQGTRVSIHGAGSTVPTPFEPPAVTMNSLASVRTPTRSLTAPAAQGMESYVPTMPSSSRVASGSSATASRSAQAGPSHASPRTNRSGSSSSQSSRD